MLRPAFGGVIFDASGKVLLRLPSNGFDDTAWTFAKGKHEGNCTPEATAIREVQEETGYPCRIVGRVPGAYIGSTSINQYFLMVPGGPPGNFGGETEAVIWVSPEDAIPLINQTTNEVVRKRDLQVLEAAVGAHKALARAQSDPEKADPGVS